LTKGCRGLYKAWIPEEVEHRVTELLSESRRSLLVKKVEVAATGVSGADE